MALMLHAGAQPVEYANLKALPLPEATETHFPIPHYTVVDVVRHMLSFYGHEVTAEHHGVTPDGMRYFGVLCLKSQYGNYEDLVGLRNSNDKKFPIGIAYGSRVFVCDNMALIGDHVVKRKHTANSRHELPSIMSMMIEPLATRRRDQYQTLQLYQNTDVSDQLADHAILRMYRDGVINVQRIPDVLKQWEEPECDWGEKTAYRLFNACTFALKGKVLENPASTKRLHQIIDGVCERL